MAAVSPKATIKDQPFLWKNRVADGAITVFRKTMGDDAIQTFVETRKDDSSCFFTDAQKNAIKPAEKPKVQQLKQKEPAAVPKSTPAPPPIFKVNTLVAEMLFGCNVR